MSSDDDRSDWFDPRLTVFIIWGIFVILFVCIPSKRFVQRLCYLMGCTRCGYEEGITPTNNQGGGHDMSYEILSNARKQEIDSLRASHLTFRLHPFSLTLEKKHMLNSISERVEDADESAKISQNNEGNTVVPQDRKQDPAEQSKSDENNTAADIETGFVRGIDPPEGDAENDEEENKQEECDGEEKQYTHVSIPLPGHNFDFVDVLELSATKKDEKDTGSYNNNMEEKKPKKRLFGGKGSKQNQQSGDSKKDEKKEVDTTTDATGTKEKRRRSCPIFCAICLAEYEISERVSWSSNTECTHVFHEDCIVEWLVSLGKTKSKNLRFSDDPSEGQLLNYQLECPCCRQEFVSRKCCELPPLIGEENA